jgi:NADPH:quinone reductase-like Zn-dependent oxidoreductase
VPLVALTAWQALVELADVRAGQKVLIHAGSGGAHRVIDYKTEQFDEVLSGYDVVLDPHSTTSVPLKYVFGARTSTRVR